MILTATEFLARTLDVLPSDQRKIIDSHFVEGNSIFTIQRRLKLKRLQIEQTLQVGLAAMRKDLLARGVRSTSDLI